MDQYLDLLRDIRDNGVRTPTRAVLESTGEKVDALAVFGRQLRFDLAAGFPLVTTKRMAFDAIVHELLWFLRGESNVRSLQEAGVRIWDSWSDAEGEVGPSYGHVWRNFGGRPFAVPKRPTRLRDGVPATYCGVANGSGSVDRPLYGTWTGMIDRCYAVGSVSYAHYGARGVRVCDRWLEYAAFEADAQLLPGWKEKSGDFSGYVLDKDGRGYGFEYGPDSCQWVTPAVNMALKNDRVFTVERDGIEYEFTNISRFCGEHGVESKAFSALWTDHKNAEVRSGFRLVRVQHLRPVVDQIAELLRGIRQCIADPTASVGRRLIVTAWDPVALPPVALPPCHLLFQMRVLGGRLHCHMFQRSADMFLGVPFNIASYALLTMLVAKVTGLEPGEFVHSISDAHIYTNHLDQVDAQLAREPLPLSLVSLDSDIRDLGSIDRDWIRLHDYRHHPSLRGEVAV